MSNSLTIYSHQTGTCNVHYISSKLSATIIIILKEVLKQLLFATISPQSDITVMQSLKQMLISVKM